MRAIILAAGRGLRLQQDEDQHTPKCLLSFGGMSLLERHLQGRERGPQIVGDICEMALKVFGVRPDAPMGVMQGLGELVEFVLAGERGGCQARIPPQLSGEHPQCLQAPPAPPPAGPRSRPPWRPGLAATT